ncbi:MAG: PfkB family carbohydrate kinase [Propionibacteriaceae bacterium]|jgi:fructokinase|nr:PfkB family carbohydrate kinase [Propionibacteriaceae bacterium]
MSQETALLVGETIMDVVCRAGAEPAEHPGGSPLNVAVGLGRLGRHVVLDTWMGEDERGKRVVEHLSASRVELAPGSTGAPRTSTSRAAIDADGRAEYTFDLLCAVPPIPVGLAPVVAHTGSVASVLPDSADAVFSAVASVRDTATICYDPNIRAGVLDDSARLVFLAERLIGQADVVKASDEDLAALYPASPPQESARRWARCGPAVVVLTRGPEGSVAHTCDGRQFATGVSPGVVVADTVGAGDSLMAGLIHALWSEGLLGAARREALRAADDEAWRRVLALAARVAEITVSRAGADPPWLAEL